MLADCCCFTYPAARDVHVTRDKTETLAKISDGSVSVV